jgi:hypothetical protein
MRRAIGAVQNYRFWQRVMVATTVSVLLSFVRGLILYGREVGALKPTILSLLFSGD